MGRLTQHCGQLAGRNPGGGDHRASVFRRHVGAALIRRDGLPASWLDRTRRIAEVHFPRIKRLADFNPDAIPGIAATLATLAAGAWIDAGEPVVLLGDSGTGKSHLLIGLGLAACEQGRRVRYATTAQLVNELAEAAHNRQLSRVVGRYGRLDLLLLDL